jgi:hypothetical protein
MSDVSEVLKLLGFSTPVIYASATYSLFHYLDRKASDKAKRAISAWFKPFEYDTATVSSAMIELFDGLYTTPLFGWRAMLRSSCFSLAMLIVFVYEFDALYYKLDYLFGGVLPILISNVVSDYLSLFVIRRWLAKGGKRPLFTILTGALIGAIIVLAAISCFGFIFNLIFLVDPIQRLKAIVSFPGVAITWWKLFLLSDEPSKLVILSAFSVHLWLPLLGVAILCLRIANWLLWSIAKMQWFLKQGHLHPLDAVGSVAAIIVFFGTIVGRAVIGTTATSFA